MCLPNDFIEGNGTHPGCQWRIRQLSSSNIYSYLIGIGIIE
jgi:hypothetical protein